MVSLMGLRAAVSVLYKELGHIEVSECSMVCRQVCVTCLYFILSVW
jgi:hypothetical protein